MALVLISFPVASANRRRVLGALLVAAAGRLPRAVQLADLALGALDPRARIWNNIRRRYKISRGWVWFYKKNNSATLTTRAAGRISLSPGSVSSAVTTSAISLSSRRLESLRARAELGRIAAASQPGYYGGATKINLFPGQRAPPTTTTNPNECHRRRRRRGRRV